jgi:hypothetical protein
MISSFAFVLLAGGGFSFFVVRWTIVLLAERVRR